MNPARIAELLDPFLRAPSAGSSVSDPAQAGEESAGLAAPQLEHISTYIDILMRWNSRINLTAIRDAEEIVTRHFGESFFAARHLFPGRRAGLRGRVEGLRETGASAPASIRVADLGSGAGFPGLPLKLWAPHIALTLIESNHKKAAFLREVTRGLTLTNVDIQNTRAETLTGGAPFDFVTLRAVERFESVLQTAASLVAPSGRLALLVGLAQYEQACSIAPELVWDAPVPIPHSRARILLTALKRV
jgi:16S rRNA (guanine527-N7)-methyltransferase